MSSVWADPSACFFKAAGIEWTGASQQPGCSTLETGASKKPLCYYFLSEMKKRPPPPATPRTTHTAPHTTTEGIQPISSLAGEPWRVCGWQALSLGPPRPGQTLAGSSRAQGTEPPAVGAGPLPVVWKPLPTAGLLDKANAI